MRAVTELLRTGVGWWCGTQISVSDYLRIRSRHQQLQRLMASPLFGISPLDVTTYVAVSLGLVAVAMLASCLPAHSATGLDPMKAQRAE